jgi:hypothetical protein
VEEKEEVQSIEAARVIHGNAPHRSISFPLRHP